LLFTFKLKPKVVDLPENLGYLWRLSVPPYECLDLVRLCIPKLVRLLSFGSKELAALLELRRYRIALLVLGRYLLAQLCDVSVHLS